MMDWIYLGIGKRYLASGSISCINQKYLVATDNKGSIIFLVFTVVTYSYAVVMLWIFYFIPKKSGLVVNLALDGSEYKIDTLDSRSM